MYSILRYCFRVELYFNKIELNLELYRYGIIF